MRIQLLTVLLFISHLLTACGGGGATNLPNSDANITSDQNLATPDNRTPVANSTPLTLTYNSVQTLTVNATDPDNDALSYTITSQPHYGKLSPVSNKPGTFTYTPTIKYIGVDSFTFTATDGDLTSLPATVKLTYWSNSWPIANAGGDQMVNANSTINLSGKGYNEGSSAYDASGKKLPLTYRWQQTDNTGIQATLMDANSPTLRLQTPAVSQDTILTFALTVQTSQGNSATDTIKLTLKPFSGQSRVALGAYIPGDAWNTQIIDQFNADTNTPLSLVNIFSTFDSNWQSLGVLAQQTYSRNATPLITWMPESQSQPMTNLLPAIVAGKWDTYINTWIAGLETWQANYPTDQQPQLLIRFGHEFNGKWYAWGNDPENYRLAWQHIHDLFNAAQVKNVEWVWCMNNFSFDDINDPTRYYPGDAYVDWTAIDIYNWGSNMKYSRWSSFSQLVEPAYNLLTTQYPSKPVMIAEVASAEASDLPNPTAGLDGDNSDADESKEAWISDMFTSIELSFPRIRALLWFNQDKTLHWALNGTGHTGAAAYGTAVNNSEYFGGMYVPASQQPQSY
ncbi:glycoside hydrolase family 26 protein [Thiothrix lacustris]|uniref:glycoside hydrolase family 26 protein n=1 Tax=Thiothrix lacustris TaxID=525917 RepID=UPI00048F6E29|nr:Ig-like domain-containing protein [Thiothrix lacustris]